MSDLQRFSAASLMDFVAQAYQRMDVPPDDARLAAKILVEADLMGIESHGVAHLMVHPSYVLGFKQGLVNPRPNIRIVHETPSTALVDGDGGLGAVVAHRAMSIAIEKAKECGTGMVAVTRSRHYGAAGYYALMAIPHDMIGLALTNSPPFVAPTFGRGRMLGTNPIAVAVPVGSGYPFLLDMATSAASHGKFEMARKEGKPIPPTWGADEEGNPSTDITQIMTTGWLLPLGSTPEAASYKGYDLAMVVDILSGVLSGLGYSLHVHYIRHEVGHFFGALRVDGFRPVDDFKAMMDEMLREFRSAPTVPGAERVLVAGQLEFETRAERLINGIPLHTPVVAMLQRLADELGLTMPEALPPAKL
ncbi:MAG: Ldh family oxidoreductase [Dehalococcoidia bacterium]